MKRDYLVFCSTNHGKAEAELYGENRLFDVAIHDYGKWCGVDPGIIRRGEYWFPFPNREKFETAAINVVALPPYRYYAFLDDDLTISTVQLNRLFMTGDGLSLELYQPSLDASSYYSHRALVQQYAALPVQPVPFVEIMCPFFSRAAYERCRWSFDLNESGWGLDCYIWPKLVRQCYVLNNITIGHYRRPARRERVMRNGLTPAQECDIVGKINYDGDGN